MPAVKDFFQGKRKKSKLRSNRSEMVRPGLGKEKGRPKRTAFLDLREALFLAAGCAGRAARRGGFEPGLDVEAHVRVEFHGNGFRFFHQGGFDQEFVSVNFVVFLLIQSKRQARPASASRHVDPDRGHFLAGEVHIELLFGSLRKFEHGILL